MATDDQTTIGQNARLRRSGNDDTVINTGKELNKNLSFLHLFAYVIGALAGSGVFVSPNLVAKQTSNMGIAIIIWITSGIISLLCGLCLCELACLYGKAGGMYLFIKEAYGDVLAFTTIWTHAFITIPAGLAIMAVAISKEVMSHFHVADATNGVWLAKMIAVCTLFVCLFINLLSASLVMKIHMFLAASQMVVFVFVFLLGTWQIVEGNTKNYPHMFDGPVKIDVGTLSLALFSSLFAFDGWGFICNLIEETHKPETNLRLSNITGIFLITCCFVLLNLSYMTVMSHAEIASSKSVMSEFIGKCLGNGSPYMVTVFVVFSCLGSMNVWLVTVARSLMSASREGQFMKIFSYIHSKSRIPVPALAIVCITSIAYVVIFGSDLQSLIAYFSCSSWLICALAIFSTLVMRVQRPDVDRPYKVFILNPFFMSAVCCFLVFSSFIKAPLESGISIGLLSTGVPLYFLTIARGDKDSSYCKLKGKFHDMIAKYFDLTPCVYRNEGFEEERPLREKDDG